MSRALQDQCHLPSPVQNLAVSTRASVSLPSADVAALSQPRDESSGTQVTVLCPSGAFFIADAPLPKVQAGCAMFAICPHPACPSVLCAGLTTLLIPKGAPACLVHQARLQPSEIQVRLIKPCCSCLLLTSQQVARSHEQQRSIRCRRRLLPCRKSLCQHRNCRKHRRTR